MSKLYEVRIYEPAVAGGLFPRPERWRYTNVRQYQPDDPTLGKFLNYGQGGYWFSKGVAKVYDPGTDAMTHAEIVGEIDAGRAMEKDRFVFVERGGVMKTEDRIMQFFFTAQFGFALAVAIQDKSKPWWVWPGVAALGAFAYWLPEAGCSAERIGERVRRWLDGL